jgi:hypothetical protein
MTDGAPLTRSIRQAFGRRLSCCGLSRSAQSAARSSTTSCGFEASEAIPFPTADSIFSIRCGAISNRLRLAVRFSRAAIRPAETPRIATGTKPASGSTSLLAGISARDPPNPLHAGPDARGTAGSWRRCPAAPECGAGDPRSRGALRSNARAQAGSGRLAAAGFLRRLTIVGPRCGWVEDGR